MLQHLCHQHQWKDWFWLWSVGLSQQRAVVFVQRVQESRGGGGRRGKMEDGREKHRLCSSLFCIWETAGKKRLNKIFNWSKPTKQCCQQLCGQMPQGFLPWERLRSLMKPESWWLIVRKPLKFFRKQFSLPHPPIEMFPFRFSENPPDALLHLARVWNGTKQGGRRGRNEILAGGAAINLGGEVSGRNVPSVTSQMPHFRNCTPSNTL